MTTEAAEGRTAWILAATIFVAAFAVDLHAMRDHGSRLVHLDALDYAQMGRQLAAGGGMTSLQAFPYAVGWLEAQGLDAAPPWPNVWRFPLPVLTRAAFFTAFGATDAVALLPSVLFASLAAALLFLLANHLGGIAAGLLASGVWIASAGQQQLAASGLSEAGAAALVAAIALALVRATSPRTTRARGATLALGVLFGLAFLQRANLLALAPGCAALLLWRGRFPALRQCAWIAVAAALVALPWLVRNALLSGDPFINLTSDRGLLRVALGEDPFASVAQHDVVAAIAAHWTAFPQRWSVGGFGRALLFGFGRDLVWLLPAACLGLFVQRHRDAPPLAAVAVSALLLTAALFLPLYPQVLRFYWPYAPLLLAIASAGAVRLASRASWPAAPAATAAALALAFVAAAPRDAPAPLLAPGHGDIDVHALARALPPHAIVLSDVSAHVAWQAVRPSIRFGGVYSDLDTLEHAAGKLAAVLFSRSFSEHFAAQMREPPLSARYLAPMAMGANTLWIHHSARPVDP